MAIDMGVHVLGRVSGPHGLVQITVSLFSISIAPTRCSSFLSVARCIEMFVAIQALHTEAEAVC